MDPLIANIPDWVAKAIILRGTMGSTVHGLALEGTDDLDQMGVCIEPIDKAITLGSEFEQHIFRTAAERTGKHDARSEPGDLDLTVFSLRKFCRLAAAGNPTVLLLLFTPDWTGDARGTVLRDMYKLFISREAGRRFLGYMQGQRQRLLGQKGQKRVKRPELEEKYGYDTKYAMHVIRLGYQGVELLTTGKLELPMAESVRGSLMALRKGEWALPEVLNTAEYLENQVKALLETSSLPEHPDRPAIESWLQNTYVNTWSAQRSPLVWGESATRNL